MEYVCWVATRTPRGIDVKTKRRSLTARAEKENNICIIFRTARVPVSLFARPAWAWPVWFVHGLYEYM